MRKKTIVFLAIGGLFVIFGAFRGEILTVINKGINLCLECVGIG